MITQADVDSTQALLDAGLGAGEFGDANDDTQVDCHDLAALRKLLPTTTIASTSYALTLDADLDGDVDAGDESALLGVYEPLHGDANDSLSIDFVDMNIVLASFGSTPGGPSWNPRADFDHDEDVDFVDLNVVLGSFGTSCS